MPIYDQHKLIFIHIPKCAGTSINNFYAPNLEKKYSNPSSFSLKHMFGRELQHITARRMSYLAPLRFRKYFKFAIVRHPVDRMYSEYKWRKSWDIDTAKYSFSEFLATVPYRQKDPHFRPSSDFVFANNGLLLVDYVAKLETIDADLRKINDLVNLSFQGDLGVSNVTVKEKSYSEEDIKFIKRFYLKDFESFGYEV